MHTRFVSRFPILVLALVIFGACTGPMYRQPEVTLQNVQLAGLGLRGGTLLVNLKVVNPNRFALNAERLRYDLLLRDSRTVNDTVWINFASGVLNQNFTVAARDSGSVEIPVEFTYAGLGGAASSLMRAGTFDYRASGTVDVRTPLGPYEVPFARRGTITLMGER
ncbi:hypothetical protein BH24GEM3_BH24GEM3_19180 [soil metagenome]